jgi:plasmid stabilization system protein ParE
MPLIEFDPRAVAEAKAARRWYAQRSASAAERFLAALDRAIERIGAAPRQSPTYLLGTRVCQLHRFPYLLVYREGRDMIQIVAVAHARRRPGYWKKRLG